MLLNNQLIMEEIKEENKNTYRQMTTEAQSKPIGHNKNSYKGEVHKQCNLTLRKQISNKQPTLTH